MTSTQATVSGPSGTETAWPKPGPGSWELDTAHFGPGCSRIIRDSVEQGMSAGLAQGFALVGGALKGMDAAFVNGRFYRRIVPLVGGDREGATPPAPVLWLAARLHPALRKGNRVAEQAIAGRVWLAEHRRWETEWKPALLVANRSLTAVDPTTLTDAELADHVEEATAHLLEGDTLHFRLHTTDLGPIGLLLVRGREWGLNDVEVMSALGGHSPATNAPVHALRAIRDLVGDAQPSTLAELLAVSPEVDAAVAVYLEEYGHRVTTGYDITDRTLNELPELVMAGVMNAGAAAPISAGAEALDKLRLQVPPDDRAELEQLVDDARAMYGLRDENGPLTHQWPAGLLRRAVLEAGRRLQSHGSLPAMTAADGNPSVFDLTGAEIATLLRGGDRPTIAEIGSRYAERQRWLTLDPPPWLGPVPDDPPLKVFPRATARLMEIVLAVLELVETQASKGRLQGTGIGQDRYVGRACVVIDSDGAVDQMEPGDVVVAPFTVPTYNSVLAMAGAVVTEHGGLLSHAAVIAREYGIPAVVGAAGATADIPDGAMIEVDPSTGQVTILSSS